MAHTISDPPPAPETLLAQAHADLDAIAANDTTTNLEYLAATIRYHRNHALLTGYVAANPTRPTPAADTPEPTTGP